MTTPVLCRCGCGTVVPRKHGRQAMFLSRAHFHAFLRRPGCPIQISAATRARGREVRMLKAAAASPNSAAWMAGYRTGYNRAYRAFKARERRLFRKEMV
jgi:hypothetical protein